MNVDDLKNFLEQDFSATKDTLMSTSYDKANKEYVCDSLKESFNYDNIIRIIYKGLNNPETPDAIYFNDKINFIEFKNGDINGRDRLRLRIKALEGLYNFALYVVRGIDTSIADNLRYIVVYNEQKNPADEEKDKMIEHLGKKAQTKHIRFGLERFVGIYFSEVLTLSKKEFSEEFLKEII